MNPRNRRSNALLLVAAMTAPLLLTATLWRSTALAAKEGKASPQDDLAKLQGSWERGTYKDGPTPSAAQAVKLIEGNKETVTYYDASGNVLAVSTANFKLDAHGPVRLYTYSDLEFTKGPDAGKKLEQRSGSIVYRVSGDVLYDVYNVAANSSKESKPAVVEWHRADKGRKGGVTPADGAAPKGN